MVFAFLEETGYPSCKALCQGPAEGKMCVWPRPGAHFRRVRFRGHRGGTCVSVVFGGVSFVVWGVGGLPGLPFFRPKCVQRVVGAPQSGAKGAPKRGSQTYVIYTRNVCLSLSVALWVALWGAARRRARPQNTSEFRSRSRVEIKGTGWRQKNGPRDLEHRVPKICAIYKECSFLGRIGVPPPGLPEATRGGPKPRITSGIRSQRHGHSQKVS
jgi:hypothetical protein